MLRAARGRWNVPASTTLHGSASLLAALLGQPAGSAGGDPDFGIWVWVLVAFVVAPIVMYTVKYIGEKRRDRKTRELIEESNREGPVPDLPPDFEVPQVVPRRSKPGRRR
jgi:heme exporter protein D